MKIYSIDENITQYTFHEAIARYPFNIVVLQDGETAILIDTAYEQHAAQVKALLEEKGIREFIILLSHHHEDHFEGCKSFPDCQTYASELFAEDHQDHLQADEFMREFKPTQTIVDGEVLKLGSFEIKCYAMPGHNQAEISYLINNQILFVGDLIFENKAGLPSLPYLDDHSRAETYIDSLQLIREINPKVVLQGHGRPLDNPAEINKQIENRIFYLRKIQNAKNDLPLADCLPDEEDQYSGLNFHPLNLQKEQNG